VEYYNDFIVTSSMRWEPSPFKKGSGLSLSSSDDDKIIVCNFFCLTNTKT